MENGQLHQIMLQKFSREIDLNPNEVNKTGSNQNSFLKKTFKFIFFRHPFERLVLFFLEKKIIFTHSNAVVPSSFSKAHKCSPFLTPFKRDEMV